MKRNQKEFDILIKDSLEYSTPFGTLILYAEDCSLSICAWKNKEASLNAALKAFIPASREMKPHDLSFLSEVKSMLDDYFINNIALPTVPLKLRGTEFQVRVWEECSKVIYGSKSNYRELAYRIGCRSPQAVGNALGMNPVNLFVPCHRIVSASGALGGYAGGLDTKRMLLEHENNILFRTPI